MKRILAFVSIMAGLSCAQAAETPAAPAGAASIQHVPVTTVLRGQPAHVVAQIHAAPGSMIAQVRVLTRVTDVGTPIPYNMSGGPGDGAYASEVPWSAISELPRFWYHVEVRDSLGRVNSTQWFPVNIINPPAEEGSAKGAPPSSRTLAIVGGIALAGGVVAVGENNNWFRNDNEDGTPTPDPAPAPSSGSRKKKDKAKLDPCAPGAPPPTVSLDPLTLSPFDTAPIQAKVCGACSNSTIRVVTSWGFNGTSPVTDLLGCTGGASFSIFKPTSLPNANAEWLQFFDGAQLIYSTSWPDPSLFLLGAPPLP